MRHYGWLLTVAAMVVAGSLAAAPAALAGVEKQTGLSSSMEQRDEFGAYIKGLEQADITRVPSAQKPFGAHEKSRTVGRDSGLRARSEEMVGDPPLVRADSGHQSMIRVDPPYELSRDLTLRAALEMRVIMDFWFILRGALQ